MSKRHEPHWIDARALHRLAMIFATVLILIVAIMYWLWRHVHTGMLSVPPPVIPPQPRLEAAPPVDREALYRAQARRLASYGWLDSQRSAAHIPIERAMQLLTEQPAQAASGQHGRSGSP